MFNVLTNLFLLSHLFINGYCLTLKGNERALYTNFTEQRLSTFFSTISHFEENYHDLSRLFKSRDFDFIAYHTTPVTLEERDLISKNYTKISMHHVIKIYRLQETDYGREWLLENLDKLTTVDLSVASMEPDFFTLEQQKDILTFALKHQRPFMWKNSFCTIFPDLSVFDDELLWLYLDQECFNNLPEERHPEMVNILHKRVIEGTDPTAILFLILTENSHLIDWENVNLEPTELKNLFKDYEEARSNENQNDKLYALYELLVSQFKTLSFENYSTAIPHIWLLFDNLRNNVTFPAHDEIVKFINTYHPRDLNCYLVVKICRAIYDLSPSWNAKLELPPIWKDELSKHYTFHMPKGCLSHTLRIEQWRKDVMHLTYKKSTIGRDEKCIYPNAVIRGMLAVDYYASNINHQLVENGYLKFDPTLKFDCKKVDSKPTIFRFWQSRVYQMAVYGTLLPALEDIFEKAIFMNNAEADAHKREPNKLASAVCINSDDVSFDTVENIIIFTADALSHFNLQCYYDNPREKFTLF